jgi:hypothetical protein
MKMTLFVCVYKKEPASEFFCIINHRKKFYRYIIILKD